jgi:S1-C subfamily serine protease
MTTAARRPPPSRRRAGRPAGTRRARSSATPEELADQVVERRGAFLLAVLLVGATAVAGERQWSWLGVRIRDLAEQEMEQIAAKHGLREGFGVVIVEVIEGAPGATAGLRAGDIVVAFGDRPVTESRLLQRLIAAAPAGAESRLTVLRDEGRQRVTDSSG